MMEAGSTAEMWAQRVRSWRASGQRAEDFSRGEGYAASTLRWYAAKLKRESDPEVRLARVVRTVSTAPSIVLAPIMIDVSEMGTRVAVGPGADRETLAMVVEVLRGASR